MVAQYNFYMDDSGTRHPDHRSNHSAARFDWFGLGGVLVRDEDEERCRDMHAELCRRWGVDYPLHSHEIRNAKNNFRWLGTDLQTRGDFLSDLQSMLLAMPVIGVACVIDRPGYYNRYHERYGAKSGCSVTVRS